MAGCPGPDRIHGAVDDQFPDDHAAGVGSLPSRVWLEFALLLAISFTALLAWAFVEPTFMFFWIASSFAVAGLGNEIYDPALSALLLDLAPGAYKSRIIGLKSTASSLGSMAGPALLAFLAPYLASREVFALSLLLVLVMTLITMPSLRVPAPTSE